MLSHLDMSDSLQPQGLQPTTASLSMGFPRLEYSPLEWAVISFSNTFPILPVNKSDPGTSLGAQWLGPCTPQAGDLGLIPGGETIIPHMLQLKLLHAAAKIPVQPSK